MRPVLDDLAKGPGRTIVLDLSQLDHVDSFGIGLFLVAMDEVQKAGNTLVIRNPQGGVKRIFALANLDTLLNIEGSEPAAKPAAPATPPPSHTGLRVSALATAADGSHSVRLSGRFTFADHEEFEELLKAVKQCGRGILNLDLSNLEFMDSAGLSMLLIAREEAIKAGVTLVLHSPTGRVAQLMRLAAVDSLVDIRVPG